MWLLLNISNLPEKTEVTTHYGLRCFQATQYQQAATQVAGAIENLDGPPNEDPGTPIHKKLAAMVARWPAPL